MIAGQIMTAVATPLNALIKASMTLSTTTRMFELVMLANTGGLISGPMNKARNPKAKIMPP